MAIIISTFEDLLKIGNDAQYPLSGAYELAADIDASGQNLNIGSFANPFTGSFTGKGHKISNVYSDHGMFAKLSGASVNTLEIENMTISSSDGSSSFGAIAGDADGATVSDCIVTASNIGFMGMSMVYVAGIVGNADNVTTIDRCFFSGAVSNTMGATNPIAGQLQNGSAVSNCYFDSTVYGGTSSDGSGPLSTAQAKQQSSYFGWDFSTIWQIVEGVSYPTLIDQAIALSSPVISFNQERTTDGFRIYCEPVPGATSYTYHVYDDLYTELQSGPFTPVGASTSSGNDGFLISGLPANQQFFVSVVASNGASESDISNELTIVSAAVALITPSHTPSTVALAWNEIPGATGYNVYMNNVLQATTDAAVRTHTFDSLSTVTFYKFYVEAVGVTGYTSTLWMYTGVSTPEVPTSSNITSSAVQLSWSGLSGAGITNEVYSYNSSNSSYTLLGSTSDTTYTVTGLQPSTQYEFKVKTYHAASNQYSEYSASATVTTSTNTSQGGFMENLPSTPIELRLRATVGKHGDTGNQLHAKIDRLSSDSSSIISSIGDISDLIGAPAGADISSDLAAIKAVVDAISASSGSGLATVLNDVHADVGGLNTLLTSGAYGLSALYTKIDAADLKIQDVQSKLGTPVGASIAADIANVNAAVAGNDLAIKALIGTPGKSLAEDIAAAQADIKGDTDDLQSKLGTPIGASIAADIAANKTAIDAVDTKITSVGTTLANETFGLSALDADLAEVLSRVAQIQNNTRTTVALLEQMEAPEAEQVAYYRIQLNNYDNTGNMEDPDAAPTVSVKNFEGTSRSGNLVNDAHEASTTMIKDSDGQYHIFYKVSAVTGSVHALEGLMFSFSLTESAVTRITDRVARVVEEVSTTFSTSDRATLAAVLVDTADIQPKLGTPVVSISADIADLDADVVAAKAVIDSTAADVDAILVDLSEMENKDGNATFDKATDSLEAIRDFIEANINTAKSPKIVIAKKVSGAVSQGSSVVVALGLAEGVTSSYINIKEVRVVPTTLTSTNFTVELFEDSACTIPLLRYLEADSSKDDLRLAVDLVFANQDAPVAPAVYVKISDVTDSGSSIFNVEVRGSALQA